MQGIFLRKYGVQTTVDFDLFEIDGVDFAGGESHAAGDTKVIKDGGASANTSNGYTDESPGYSIVLDETEMQAARIRVFIVDQGTKAWLDTSITIETYGHASAMHGQDLDTTVPTVAEIQAEMEENGASVLDTIQDRLTASRAGYLDELAAANLPADIDTLLTRVTAAVALASVCTETRLSELDAATGGKMANQVDIIQTDTTTDIPATLATIAGYLDTEIAAIITHLTEIKGAGWTDENLTTIDSLIDTLTTRIPAAVALASVCTEARLAELAAANLPTDIAGIASKTTNLPADPASETNVNANETKIDIMDALIDTLITRIPSEVAQKGHLVNGSGDIVPPTNKGIWDSLGDGSQGVSDLPILQEILADSTAFNGAELNPATSGKLAYYVSKLAVAWLNKELITEASGNLEQFDDSDVSIGTIASALTSDGTHTTRLRLVQ